ncbi:MAG: hypothetical protein LUI87_13235 [Lachnospiraceae bacterium]|nr:hypothetical protein [Lachnospiraceae bacterium]
METVRTDNVNLEGTVRLDEWIRTWYRSHPGERMPIEEADRLFVWLCQLLRREYGTLLSGKNPEDTAGRLSSESFLMDRILPVGFQSATGCMDYCPADEVTDETTYLFGMGLILYELLTGDTYTNASGNQVGIPFFWSILQEQANDESRSSLLDASDLPAEYEAFGNILSLLTQYSQSARQRCFPGGALPASDYEWDALDAENGLVIRHTHGKISGPDDQHAFPAVLSENGKQYQAEEGQETVIHYSFLKKHYQIRYREIISVSPEDWDEGDLGILVDDGNGGRIFVPLLLGDEPGIRRRLAPDLPSGYSSWNEVPYLTLTIIRRKKSCRTASCPQQQPEAFRIEKRLALEVRTVPGEPVAPQLELFTDGTGKFKITCDWVSADGGKLEFSEAGD